MLELRLMNIYELEYLIEYDFKDNDTAVLFCFGTSLISRIIQAKTRLNKNEVVPSHVAMITKHFIFESTTGEEHIGNKYIRQGVRRWLISDFIEAEKSKLTKYILVKHPINLWKANQYVHLPYGKDIILDFLLKDGSDGDSKGLICSQYVNKCIEPHSTYMCPSPADLLRIAKKYYNIDVIE